MDAGYHGIDFQKLASSDLDKLLHPINPPLPSLSIL